MNADAFDRAVERVNDRIRTGERLDETTFTTPRDTVAAQFAGTDLPGPDVTATLEVMAANLMARIAEAEDGGEVVGSIVGYGVSALMIGYFAREEVERELAQGA